MYTRSTLAAPHVMLTSLTSPDGAPPEARLDEERRNPLVQQLLVASPLGRENPHPVFTPAPPPPSSPPLVLRPSLAAGVPSVATLTIEPSAMVLTAEDAPATSPLPSTSTSLDAPDTSFGLHAVSGQAHVNECGRRWRHAAFVVFTQHTPIIFLNKGC